MTHPCVEFLRCLDQLPAATFNIECYTDTPKGVDKPRPDPMQRRYPARTIDQVERLIPELETLNEQGAGIFVAVNQCTGHRSAESITRVRGIHADMDNVTLNQISAVTTVLAPSITVQSSTPERQQLYWLLNADEVLQKDETKAINQRLVGYGADKSAVDSSRLLRLVGFKHMKYRQEGRTPTVTAVYSGATYTADEIRAAFPPQTKRTSTRATPVTLNQTVAATSDLSAQLVDAIEQDVAASERQLWTGNWQAIGQFGQQSYPSLLIHQPN